MGGDDGGGSCGGGEAIGHTGLELTTKLFGKLPQGSFCRVADPEACWAETKRRESAKMQPPPCAQECAWRWWRMFNEAIGNLSASGEWYERTGRLPVAASGLLVPEASDAADATKQAARPNPPLLVHVRMCDQKSK